MSTNKANVVKKRRAPLPPKKVHPKLENDASNDSYNDSGSTERLPKTLPLCEPIFESRPTSKRYSWQPDSGIVKLAKKRRSLGDITIVSDNDVLDVHRRDENINVLGNTRIRNGHKRHSSGDVSKILHASPSKSSLRSLNFFDRSLSLNSLCSSDIVEMVDQEDIVTLTSHVRHFSEALSTLRNAFPTSGSDTESDEYTDRCNAVEETHVRAHECLGKVLLNLKEVINRYPSLQSNEILAAAGNLIGKVRNLNGVDDKISDDFYHAIDQLALVFSSSISDLLMGDQELSPNKVGDDGDDGDDFPEDGYEDDGSEGDVLSGSINLPSRQESLNDILRGEDADLERLLLKMELGVDFCLQWTKYWSKYVKDIANYIEKRAQLEAEYTKQLTNLAQKTRASISEENYLPFQSTFITALDQDMEYSQKCQQTLVGISGSKFMEPLMQRRSYHDRARKDMKDEWTKTCKQLQDSATSVKTSQNLYHKRQQELEKLSTRQSDVKENKDDSFSVFSLNKGKKEEECRSKVVEAEQLCINAIKFANDMQNEAEKTKIRIVTQTKQLVNECDRTFRMVTRKYFDMMHELAVPTPIHFKTLADSCQGYEPGKEFEDFVRFQQSTARPARRPYYEFQQYPSLRSSNELESPLKGNLSPIKAWTSGQTSDYDGGGSPAGSPSSSPKTYKKIVRARPQPPPSTDEESEGEIIKKPHSSKDNHPGKSRRKGPKSTKVPLTKEALTHTFHKIRAPAKCSECDRYVFSGVECAQCGLSCHNKKCLENLNTPCSHSRRLPSPMKHMKTFGVRFSEDGGVPVLVTKCVKEINRRGLKVKGIYRVSGVKSKMENLCQEFETNADSVDLSMQPPHLIASVLKLYIRQLPEPLMTTKLYADVIQIAKESSYLNGLSIDEYEGENSKQEFKKLLEKLQVTLKKLPRSNYLTTATLIKHLHKVSINEEYNQMNPQNLAIVFGPTILRCENSTTSLSSLVDMSHQTRIVALLIVNPQVFDDVADEPEEEHVNVSNEESEGKDSLPNTPVEKFVSTKSEEDESGMPDLYGERSIRLQGVGPSPMNRLVSLSSEVKGNSRLDSGSIRMNEHDDIKGEATRVFDEASISLPGSLQERNRYFDFTQDDDRIPVLDTGRPNHNIEQNVHSGHEFSAVSSGRKKFLHKSKDDELADDGSLANEIQEEFNRKLVPSVSVGTTNIVDEPKDVSSSGECNLDDSYPRLRAKAFSVGKRNGDQRDIMLAKRGSALINAYMDNNIKSDDSDSSQRSSSRKFANHVAVDTKDLDDGTPAAITNNETVPATSTVSSTAANEIDSDIASDNIEKIRKRAGTSGTSSPSRSGDESSISALYRDTPRRKRSATYDNERRRKIESRQERLEKQLTNDRLFIQGVRSRRIRVSVKDQIKQLESQKDSPKTTLEPLSLRNNKGSGGVSSSRRGSKGALSDTPSTHSDTQVNENANALDRVDGKENVNGNFESYQKSEVKSHEPLTRLYAPGENSGFFQPPKSPVPKYKTTEETLCSLKMDNNLDSPQVPTPETSDNDSDHTNVAMETHLPTWAGRNLTPRDSSQAPEFV